MAYDPSDPNYYKGDPEAMANAGTQFDAKVTSLDTHRNQVADEIATLKAYWLGQSSNIYAQKLNDWNNTVIRVRNALQTMEDLLTNTRGVMVQQEEETGAQVGQITTELTTPIP